MIRKQNGRSYVYTSRRINGRPRKVYVGADESVAEVEAARIAGRAEAARKRSEAARSHEAIEAGDREADAAFEGVELAVEAILLAAGLHRPARKPWRLKKCPR